MSEEKRNAVHTKINDLYEICGSISPLIFFIEGLTKEFNSITGPDCQAFETQLAEIEQEIQIYYNKNGVRINADKSRMVYSVRDTSDAEGRYFYYVELANLYLAEQRKKSSANKYHLSKIFNGYSVVVESPAFVC